MSQQITSEGLDSELSWEEAVARFLEQNPDFFERRPELLAALTLSHEVEGRAVSLIERQVQALRTREQNLQRELRELLTIARENDVLGARLHRLALAVIDGRTAEETLDEALELLRNDFRLDAATIRIGVPASLAGTRPEFVAPDDRRLAAVLRQFSAGKPVCGGRYEDSVLTFLFGSSAAEIRSSALVPLGADPVRGVLALGSSDPHRFHAGMGTVYLARLGELIAHALARRTP